jgi:hypothetical protein
VVVESEGKINTISKSKKTKIGELQIGSSNSESTLQAVKKQKSVTASSKKGVIQLVPGYCALTLVKGAFQYNNICLTEQPQNLKSGGVQKLLFSENLVVPLTYAHIQNITAERFKIEEAFDLNWDLYDLYIGTPQTAEYKETNRSNAKQLQVLDKINLTFSKNYEGRLLIVLVSKSILDKSVSSKAGSATGTNAIRDHVVYGLIKNTQVKIAGKQTIPDCFDGISFSGVVADQQTAAAELIKKFADAIHDCEIDSVQGFTTLLRSSITSHIQTRSLAVDQLPKNVFYSALRKLSPTTTSSSAAATTGGNGMIDLSPAMTTMNNNMLSPFSAHEELCTPHISSNIQQVVNQATIYDVAPLFNIKIGNSKFKVTLKTLQSYNNTTAPTVVEIELAKTGSKFHAGEYFGFVSINTPGSSTLGPKFENMIVVHPPSLNSNAIALPIEKFAFPALEPDIEMDEEPMIDLEG